MGVALQGLVRVGFVRVYTGAEQRIADTAPRGLPVPLNDMSSGMSAGLGFGVMQSVVMYGSVLGTAMGEATLYLSDGACDALSLHGVTAFASLLSVGLQVLLMLLALDAHRQGSTRTALGVVGLHWVAAMATLLNGAGSNACLAVPPIVLVVLGVAAWLVVRAAQRHDYAGRKPLTARSSGSQTPARGSRA